MNRYLLSGLGRTPVTIKRLLTVIPADRYGRQTAPDRFNVREAVAHVADWDAIWLERFALGYTSPGSTIVVYDEEQMAIDRRYNERDPLAEADRLAGDRKKLLDLLSTFTPEDWNKTLVHPSEGVLTLGNFASLVLGHDVYHIEHLTEYLTL